MQKVLLLLAVVITLATAAARSTIPLAFARGGALLPRVFAKAQPSLRPSGAAGTRNPKLGTRNLERGCTPLSSKPQTLNPCTHPGAGRRDMVCAAARQWGEFGSTVDNPELYTPNPQT